MLLQIWMEYVHSTCAVRNWVSILVGHRFTWSCLSKSSRFQLINWSLCASIVRGKHVLHCKTKIHDLLTPEWSSRKIYLFNLFEKTSIYNISQGNWKPSKNYLSQCFLLKMECIPSYFFTQNSAITSHLINLKDGSHVVGKWSDLALSILVSSPTMVPVIPSVGNTEITMSVLPQGPRTCYSLCQEYSFPLQHLDLLSQFL